MQFKATACTLLMSALSMGATASENNYSEPKLSLKKGIVVEYGENKMGIHARIQNRVNMFMADDFNMNKAEALIRRMRLQINGNVGKLFYDMTVDFSGYGMDAQPNGNLNSIRQSILGYQFNDHLKGVFGQQQIQFNREFLTSSSTIAFVDRSNVNEIFSISRDFGAFITYKNVIKNDFTYVLNGSITTGEGINFDTFYNSGLCYTGAVQLYPSGYFSTKALPISGSKMNEDIVQTYIGGGYSFNNKTMRLDGQDGKQEDLILGGQRRNLQSYFVDFTARYRRFNLDASYMGRKSSDPIVTIPTTDGKSETQYSYAGQGVNLQFSYFAKNDWEYAIRTNTVFANDEIVPQIGYENWNQSGVAVSKYFFNYMVKLQADFEYNYQYSGKFGSENVAKDDYLVSFQCELVF